MNLNPDPVVGYTYGKRKINKGIQMPEHFIDKLLGEIGRKGSPVCVGIDPVYDMLPDEFRSPDVVGAEQTEELGRFCYEVLQIVAPIVPAVKIQSAYFEAYGWVGVDLYFKVVEFAHKLGLMVIGDVKRGDIGSTAQAYAQGHLANFYAPDAITVNGYFGADGLKPFLDIASANEQGIFVLVRTSNPSSGPIQDFTDAEGKKFYEHLAHQVAQLGESKELIGQSGYSCLGAVVAATYPDQARKLREIMPQQFFLVPGYGAQGASAEDCAASFKDDGTGAIVNASRSVIFAHRNERYAGTDWKQAIATAAENFANDIRKAVGL